MPWRTVSAALGKLTKKRNREYRCARRRGEKWKRISVAQFLIPAPRHE